MTVTEVPPSNAPLHEALVAEAAAVKPITVTVTVPVPVQPTDVPVTVYVVVEAGLAETVPPVVDDRPVAGDQE